MEKVGFHYRPDSKGYSDQDLALWLPKLKDLEASWVVLRAPNSQTIPENFLGTLKREGIEPVLHFPFQIGKVPPLEEMLLLFEGYKKSGVKYLILFDRPNMQENWSSEVWAQSDLPERFMDGFLPLAEAAVAVGLAPVFPPLEPGGDYWDTVFLRGALDGLKRRASEPLLNRVLLSAIAGMNGKPLSWGRGGQQSWPEAQPYFTPENSEDQCGFQIADWYLTLSETILEKKLPILLLGIRGPVEKKMNPYQPLLNGAKLIARQEVDGYDPLPEQVLGGAFWVLTGGENCCASKFHWYNQNGEPNPIVREFQRREESRSETNLNPGLPITHYLLLPSFEWGVADWHLKVTRSFIKRHRPTVGFSLDEAFQAQQVTVVGGKEHFSEDDLSKLRNHGCLVRRVDGDGPNIASLLAAI
jgi:hypothetical protein